MEVILKSIRKDKAEKRRKLMELERLVNSGGDKNEIEKLRKQISGERNVSFDDELFKKDDEKVYEIKGRVAVQKEFNMKGRKPKYLEIWEEWKDVALNNGIDYKKFTSRLRCGWTCKEAVSFKDRVRRDHVWEEWKEICEKNGVTRPTFMRKVREGKTGEEASAKYIKDVKGYGWEEWKHVCEAYGVTYNAFYQRCGRGKSPQEAASTPMHNNGKKK